MFDSDWFSTGPDGEVVLKRTDSLRDRLVQLKCQVLEKLSRAWRSVKNYFLAGVEGQATWKTVAKRSLKVFAWVLLGLAAYMAWYIVFLLLLSVNPILAIIYLVVSLWLYIMLMYPEYYFR